MTTVVLLIHIMIATSLVAVILLQRSEGGGLGIGGGNMGGLMTGRGTANLLTRTTSILAAAFIVTSMALAILAGRTGEPTSILDAAPVGVPGLEGGADPAVPALPDAPAEPQAPVAQ